MDRTLEEAPPLLPAESWLLCCSARTGTCLCSRSLEGLLDEICEVKGLRAAGLGSSRFGWPAENAADMMRSNRWCDAPQ